MAERKLTPQEFEQKLLERAQAVKDGTDNPLDTCATMFYLYNPRFQGQINHMSKKQLQTLMVSLAGSSFNNKSDLGKLVKISDGLNLNAINRVIKLVVKNPWNEPFRLSKTEEKLFILFDGLLTNKYFNDLKVAFEKKKLDNSLSMEIEDILHHQIDTTSGDFKKREEFEKDAFATGAKLLFSKYMMFKIKEDENREKEIESGK